MSIFGDIVSFSNLLNKATLTFESSLHVTVERTPGVPIMSKPEKQPGLDRRHRDLDGEIRKKNGNTKVATLRRTYGADFAAGSRSDMRLDTLLDQSGTTSLSQYRKKSNRVRERTAPMRWSARLTATSARRS